MMAGFTPASVVFPCHDRSQAWACAPQRGVGGGRRLRLFSLPFGRLRRGEIPAFREKPFTIGKNSYSVAPIWRDNMQVVGRAAWGRVCGRAKLLAGTLRCLHLCWRLPWDWSHFHAPSACSFLGLRLSPCLLPTTFREEPLLPHWNKDIISCGESPPTMDSPGLISWSNNAFFRCPSATTCSSIEACVTRRITSTLRVCPMRYARSVA